MGQVTHTQRGIASTFLALTGPSAGPASPSPTASVEADTDFIGMSVAILGAIVTLAFTALIGGEVLGAINTTSNPFNSVVTDLEEYGGLAMMLTALALIVIPVGAIIGLMRNVGGNGGGGRGGRFR